MEGNHRMSTLHGHINASEQTHTAPEEAQEVWLMVEGLDAVAELGDGADNDHTAAFSGDKECDWCGESSGSGYFVAVRDQNYRVCSMCWGRAPAYVDFRREGHSHEEARRRLSGNA